MSILIQAGVTQIAYLHTVLLLCSINSRVFTLKAQEEEVHVNYLDNAFIYLAENVE